MEQTGPRHPFLAHGRVLAFAHRGGTETAPENSLAAFASAVELGFEYLETDVHLTADGVVVAAHDEHLDRVTDSSGAIAEMPWREVSRARIGGTEPVPTFEELLEAFPGVRFNVDPKSDAVVDPLVDLLVRHDALGRVCIGAFSQRRLERVREHLGPAVCTSAGPREITALMARSAVRRRARNEGPARNEGQARDEGLARNEDGPPFECIQVPVSHRGVPVVTGRLVELAHQMDVQVHVWTVDEPAEMNRLLDLGVDGLMTDRPSVLKRVLVERGAWEDGGGDGPHDRGARA